MARTRRKLLVRPDSILDARREQREIARNRTLNHHGGMALGFFGRWFSRLMVSDFIPDPVPSRKIHLKLRRTKDDQYLHMTRKRILPRR